jgi:hypothetical protein
MRKLWNIVSFMAVVNLLALALFGGWLWQSGRIDRGRVWEIRSLLASTLAEEAAAATEAEAEAARIAAEEADRDNAARPPLPSADVVRQVHRIEDRADLAMRRLQDERDQLLARHRQRAAELDAREAQLDADREALQSMGGGDLVARADAQFRKAVVFYETAKPKLAKERLLNLYRDGEVQRVVSYLDAMNARAAKKILDEFKSEEDNRLATELLEQLRTYGLDTEVTETTGHDDAVATADSSSRNAP